jgi:hypothetical protein
MAYDVLFIGLAEAPRTAAWFNRHTPIGIEIAASAGGRATDGILRRNVDPQHGGGAWGWSIAPSAGEAGVVSRARCAATAALALRLAGCGRWDTLGEGEGEVAIVYSRPDADTVAAAAIGLMAAAEIRELAATPWGPGREALARLEHHDDPRGVRGTWTPRLLADPPTIAVADSADWRGVQALAMGSSGRPTPGVPMVSLSRAVEIAAWVLLGRPGVEPEEHAAAIAARAAALDADRAHVRERLRIAPSGLVAHVPDCRVAGWADTAYAAAPVGVATAESFGLRQADGSVRLGRKHTVSVHPDADEQLYLAVFSAAAELSTLEAGWGGNTATGIWGSPERESSALSHERVVEVVDRLVAAAR